MASSPWRTPPTPIRLTPKDRVLHHLLRGLPRLPTAVAQALAGRPVHNRRGDRLDPHTHLLLNLDRHFGQRLNERDPHRIRTGMRTSVGLSMGPPRAVGEVKNFHVAGYLPARLYRPAAASPPWLLYLHGGGWAAGDLETHDRICRRLCADGDLLVVSLDYRLAPEHPFPAAVEDAGRAWTWLAKHMGSLGGDPRRGGVGGDSAGGNLAAVVCQQARDGRLEGPCPHAQLLIYPSTDFRRLDPSHGEFSRGYLLDAESIDHYRDTYAAPDLLDPDASPLLHPDLSNLPPAVVVPADFDPLRDEGERYAQALVLAGTETNVVQGRGLVHGFVQMAALVPAADRTNAAFAAAIASLLHRTAAR